ncbi:hypothetical protein, partial [Escherichia coli]|uniref:hypothetical protein n=1 Tax=Escherichia coli TaxID=562 RepID=UPI0028DF0180
PPVQAAVPSVPQPVQAPFVPQPTALHPSGLTSEQIAQLTQLRAASIPEATILQAMAGVGVNAQQIAAFDSTPF